MSLAGAGTLAVGASYWLREEPLPSYFLITEQPDADLARLRRLAGLPHPAALNVSTAPIPPAGQDLSILYRGRLLDPAQAEDAARPVADFARTLRARPRRGHVLLAVEPAPRRPDDVVTFEHNAVVDRISLRKPYAYIDMPGAQGATVFRLRDGKLWVVASSCRHELCMKRGPQTAGRIICAPNRLVATLPHAPGAVDAITG
jgi:hypothetical protein